MAASRRLSWTLNAAWSMESGTRFSLSGSGVMCSVFGTGPPTLLDRAHLSYYVVYAARYYLLTVRRMSMASSGKCKGAWALSQGLDGSVARSLPSLPFDGRRQVVSGIIATLVFVSV